MCTFSRRLFLEALCRDAVRQILLEDQENDKNRDDGKGGHGEHGTPVRLGRGIGKHFQGDGQGILGGRIQVQQGTEEVIPAPHEGEDGSGDDGRLDQRQDDPHEYAVIAAAVNSCRFIQFHGDAADKLHVLENEECLSEEIRDGDGQHGVDPVELLEDQKLRDHDDLEGKHHGHHDTGKPDVSPGKAQTGKAEGDDGRGEHSTDGGGHGDDERVLEEGPEGVSAESAPAIGIVFKVKGLGNQPVRFTENGA